MNKATLSLAILAALTLAACSRKSEGPTPAAPETPASVQAEQTAPGAFKVGELSATALRDGRLDFPNDNKVFGVGRTTQDVAQLLSAASLPTDTVSLPVTPLLVKTSDRVLLFDTGAGTNFGPGAGTLAKSLADAGVEAGSITDIYISHVHGDHVGGLLNTQGALAYPNATIHLGAPDWEFLKGMDAKSAASVGLTQHAALISTISPKVVAFQPGADLLPGVVKAVEIRGHTPGHSGYLIGSGADTLLYIGDSMHHYVVSVQRPDWTIVFDSDAPTAQKSRSELLAQSAANGQRLYAVHFPFPGVGKIERRGDGFVWAAE